MSPEDATRYNQYWDDVSKGLDTDTRVKLNQWKYRPDADLYNKYKNVYNNPKYYNQETGAINWPANDGFVSGSQKIETLGVGTKLDRYGQPTGKFLAPKSDSFPSRSLAPHSENAPYYTYEIIEELEVTSGKIAPWFGQPGGGHNL
ncbi:TNT domain-containing protein [Clostridium sporogenes]|uniref:TNT domain-containing protein n=1 Tax=Clostridium sporogenes TaxID=1509 RepID=UPI001969B273|nr:TNT domain-containing protein [Clostridium sporogenes]MCW6123186.1 TNT domain-containing protein [Clostridium sporogenes]